MLTPDTETRIRSWIKKSVNASEFLFFLKNKANLKPKIKYKLIKQKKHRLIMIIIKRNLISSLYYGLILAKQLWELEKTGQLFYTSMELFGNMHQ